MAQVRVRNSSQFRMASSAARAVAQAYAFPPLAGVLASTSTVGSNPPKGVNAFRAYIEITAVTSTPSVVFSIQVLDSVNKQWHTLISSTAQAAVGRLYLEVGPDITAVANQSVGKFVGSKLRVIATHGNTNSMTYNITGEWTA